jgi:P27 family predicted phage terminase small subunit
MTQENEARVRAQEIVDQISKIRDFNQSERLLLDQLKEAIGDRLELEQVLRTEGMIAQGSQGQPVAHPAQAMKTAAADRISRWIRQLELVGMGGDPLDGMDAADRDILGL